MLDVETGVLAPEFAQRFPLVGSGVVQECNHGTPQVSQQMPKEHTHLLLPYVLEVELVVEAQAGVVSGLRRFPR